MRKIALAVWIVMGLFAPATVAETLVVPGELDGFANPPFWRLVAAGVDFDDEGVYIWVDAEGNCRTEWRQECHTNSQGQVVCRRVPEYKCDRDTAYYSLPETCTVDTDAKRAYYAAESGTLAFGKGKRFLWNTWISLFEGADLQVTHDSANLVLDTDQLTTDAVKENFRDLHEATE